MEVAVMKNTKKVESGKGLKIFVKIILSLLLIGFAGLAIHNICTLTVKLDDSTSQIERLETEKVEQSKQLQEAEEKNKNLDSEKKELEKKNEELKKQLEAKLEAKRKAQEQAKLASQTQVTGTCADWMREAGITDTTNAYYIFQHESGCNPKAVNQSSGAYGVCQALPGNKMASAGEDWQTNPITQMRWCNSYAHQRYGSWANAVAFWSNNKWW